MKRRNCLNVIHHVIDLDQSVMVYDNAFTKESLCEDWIIKSGHWSVKDGFLLGECDSGCGGMVFSRKEYPHDIVMEFTASIVSPSTHDLDFMWHSSWDDETKLRNAGYVVGINGWWEQKVGFEKAPENVWYGSTTLFKAEPEKEYRVQAGTIQGLCFLFIDNRLVLEMRDPDPIDYSKHPFVGFETYQSKIRVKDLRILKPFVLKRELKYMDEF